MKKIILACALCMVALLADAADTPKNLLKEVRRAAGIEVIFQSSYKGHVSPVTTSMTVVGTNVALKRNDSRGHELESGGRLRSADYQDWSEMLTRRVATLPSGRVINTQNEFRAGVGYAKLLDDDTVMGLPCHVWRFSVNSNTIDVWWTEALNGYRGTPQTFNGCAPDGLVLKIVRNGDQDRKSTR